MTTKPKRFTARDITADDSGYDVIFHDVENNCYRYSDDVWNTQQEALDAAEVFEQSTEDYSWWDEVTDPFQHPFTAVEARDET